jgi:hypothetical protein
LIPIFFFLKFGKKLLKYITPAKEKNVDRVWFLRKGCEKIWKNQNFSFGLRL